MIGLVVTGQESESFASGRALWGSIVALFLFAARSNRLKLLVFAVAMAGVARPAPAQGTVRGQAEHRYLFVVETSRAMQRRAQGVHDTLKALLDSNLNGQILPGDSIALWTFNETISTNFFPTALWSPATRASLGARLPDFLDASAYEKRALLDKLIARLESQLAIDGLLTVILVTTGEEDVQGTPFDNQLRRAFSQWRPDQQRARMPILTLLRGSHGRFNQWSVSAAPWPLEIPPLDEMAQSSRPKPNEGLKTNSPSATALTARTNSAATGNGQTNLVLAPTNTTNASPLIARINIAGATNPGAAAAAITNINAATNEALKVGSPSETNAQSTTVSNLLAAGDTAKTNRANLAANPSGRSATVDPDPPEGPPAIAFSADAPRHEDSARVPAISSRQAVDQPPSTSGTAQLNPSVSQQPTTSSDLGTAPGAADPVPSATSVPPLIPPIDPPPSKSTQIAMTESVPPNFLHENAKWIVAACISGIFAIVCILLWLSTYSRNQLDLATLPGKKRSER